MAFGRQLLAQHEVKVCIERAFCNYRGILQLKRARSGIARVSKQRLFVAGTLLIEPVENAPWHEDFASYLELRRIAAARKH